MSVAELSGYFTYRSFLNRPTGAPNDILWAEAEILLLVSDEGTVTGSLSFPADGIATGKQFMDLSGRVTAWDRLALRMVGKGRAGTPIADFEYEYDCQVANEWENAAPTQRLALVGTVRRNKDHGSAKAGATASFIAVKRDFVEPRDIPGVALIPEAVAMLADRVHRLRHTVWHTLRDDWWSPKMTDADRAKLKAFGWHLNDPPFKKEGPLDLENGAGEDFLYMHRRMILMMRETYRSAGKPYPESWKALPAATAAQFAYKEIPDPQNPQFKAFEFDAASSGLMVPPATEEFMQTVGSLPFFSFNKSPRGLSSLMRNVVTSLRSHRVASQLTLGAYGNLIEFTVHNWMHMRWATVPRDPSTGLVSSRNSYDIDRRWDAPANDYLGDFHSSHVNPIFWRLHGWVDDCIDVWFQAHDVAHPGQVKKKEVRGIPWFEQGNWVVKDDPFDWPGAGDHGGHHGHGHHGPSELTTLEEVMALLKEVDGRAQPLALEFARRETGLTGFARSIARDDVAIAAVDITR